MSCSRSRTALKTLRILAGGMRLSQSFVSVRSAIRSVNANRSSGGISRCFSHPRNWRSLRSNKRRTSSRE